MTHIQTLIFTHILLDAIEEYLQKESWRDKKALTDCQTVAEVYVMCPEL